MFAAVVAVMAAVIVLGASRAAAQNVKTYTRANVDQWMSMYADAKPDFKPGDVLGSKDLERIHPFVPPGWFEQLNFPEFKMEIMAARSHNPCNDFHASTQNVQLQGNRTHK